MHQRLLKWQGVITIGGLLICTAHAEQSNLTCQVRCSDTKLRTGIAELIWSSPVGAAATRDLPQLDVSVFHGGFTRGLYQSFGVIGEGRAPQAEPSATRDIQAEGRTTRAYDLKLRVPEKTRAVATASGGEARQQVEIENLEPGLLYRFRLRDAGLDNQEVDCEAPVCPADMKEGRKP
ncbi:MAG: hypothetical protein PHU46_04875 [Rhodocyclaceae bacterium]|nr:hypothetical protein [Rhodocyclaceae bacterium]